MSVLSKARKIRLLASSPRVITCRPRYLFILSHMRSRSSVLSHVLGSNPEICGYSELHHAYRSRLDLLKMRAALFEEARCDLSDRYLLDKLLHDNCSLSDAVIARVRPRVIILLREPEATLKSMINMGQRTGTDWYRDPQQAGRYYCRRLASLVDYGRRLPSYCFLDADELVDHTEQLLRRLSDWLQLQSPLKPHYDRFRNTGKRYYGDTSEHIDAGVIKATAGHPEISLPAPVLDAARSAYRQCRRELLGRGMALATAGHEPDESVPVRPGPSG